MASVGELIRKVNTAKGILEEVKSEMLSSTGAYDIYNVTRATTAVTAISEEIECCDQAISSLEMLAI